MLIELDSEYKFHPNKNKIIKYIVLELDLMACDWNANDYCSAR